MGPEKHFEGKIDEVKIWNYALSEDEVKTEYNSGKAAVMGERASANDDGTTVTGANKDYCIPGDIAQCSPPILEFDFNERNGTTTYDSSGNGNDGVFVSPASSPSWTSLGKISGALEFDGVDDYVEVSNLDLSGTDAVTISFWFNTDVLTSDNKMLVEYSTQSTVNNAFYINMNEFGGDGNITFLDHDDTGGTPSDLNYVIYQ